MPEEYLVADLTDFAQSNFKQVRTGPTDVLLIKLDDGIHAVEPLCPHYKQPLADGLLCGNQIRCGWHQSVFDVTTGDVCEPPAIDDLKTYPVRIDGSDIFVDVASYRADRRRFIIIGGGAAGFHAACALRENGFAGELTLVSAEENAPYDRPNLSKDFLAGKPLDTPLPLRASDFYRSHKIELRLAMAVTAIDRNQRQVALSDGSKIPYDALLIATGSIARKLRVPGGDLPGIFTLRGLRDAENIISAADQAKHVVIIGGSFVAMETAAALRQRGLAVSLVMRDAQPMLKIFGAAVGRMIRSVHESHGVKIHAGRSIEKFVGDDRLTTVVLDDEIRIDCDMAIVAVGVDPATEFLSDGLGAFMDADGGIRVDSNLQVCDGIFAAGDIARVPRKAGRVRIEHWRYAEQLGRIAACNMFGRKEQFDDVPYFWTYQFDLGLDYIGHADGWDEIVIDGDVAKRDFVACYIRSGVITAACCCGRPSQACAIAELMKRDALPTVESIRDGGFDFVKTLGRQLGNS